MNTRIYRGILSALLAISILTSCSNESVNNGKNTTATTIPIAIQVPQFNADTAFQLIEKQLSFGFRNPGSKGQEKCAQWMAQQLQVLCDTVYVQNVQVKAGDGQMLPCKNVIGAIHPDAARRILLLCHWDSRPWADQDDSAQTKPIWAADDAASGVAVLMEVARQIKAQNIPKDLGIDILFTDVEDYGKTEWGEESYCLGTQYWALHPHTPGYTAEFGILLDMVGAKGAVFPMEMISTQYAGAAQKNIYTAAQRAGFSSYFPFSQGGAITDDHKIVNEVAHIPTVDIISLSNTSPTGFMPHWHTHDDNINIIDKATLKAVGQTLLQVIYETAAQAKNPA